MRRTLLAALLAAAAADQCSVVTNPSPACGQQWDGQAMCEAKGCCWDPTTNNGTCYYPNYNAVNITTVMMIQACHFDAGFANTTVGILNLWFNHHFPLAYSIGEQLRVRGGPETLKFMAQAWIVSLYLDCPPYAGLDCPSTAALANFTDAVQKGYITWHAYPFNGEPELANHWLIEYGISIAHELDAKFGLPPKSTMSQRDVPGMTRSVLPLLKANGVQAVSVGVNGASTPPNVPRAFVWSDPASGVSMPALWHPQGYGGTALSDAVIVPGLSTALVFAWRGDNAGPPTSVEEVLSDYASVRNEFPGATVMAAQFDEFTSLLAQPAIMSQLPVITAELGDTWIHGSVSDPQKSAMQKVAIRVVEECLAAGLCNATDYVFRNASRFLMKNNEHTWGMDIKTFLHDTTHWNNTELQQQIASNASNFITVMRSWQEQRDWGLTYAIQALGGHPLADMLLAAWAELVPPAQQPSPSSNGFSPFTAGTVYNAGRYSIGFDKTTGAISSLTDNTLGRTWADGSSGSFLGQYFYLTWSVQDYATFLVEYCDLPPPMPSWFALDFGKPGLNSSFTPPTAGPLHQELAANLVSLWMRDNGATAGSVTFLVQQTVSADAHNLYGAPDTIWTQIDVPKGSGTGSMLDAVNITLMVYNKTGTRLPEATFMRFNVSDSCSGGGTAAVAWSVDKLGEWVDPTNVVLGGNQYHHGVGRRGLAVNKTGACGGSLVIAAPDAPVSAVGHSSLLPAPTTVKPDMSQGAGFMLTNNGWGTNYPQFLPWKQGDENQQWHFQLQFA